MLSKPSTPAYDLRAIFSLRFLGLFSRNKFESVSVLMLKNVGPSRISRRLAQFIRPNKNLWLNPSATLLLSRRLLSGHCRLYQEQEKSKKTQFKMTKKLLLAQSSSSLSRLWVHIKWPLTRNDRPLTMDDLSAFASWLVMGNLLWIILGTTTFGFVAMYLLDTFDKFWKSLKSATSSSHDEKDDNELPKSDTGKKRKDQSLIAVLASSVLSHGLGLKFSFERGNVLPVFEEGMLKFNNVKIYLKSSSKSDNILFSATVSLLNLTLSFKKWYEGQGLIYNMEIFGLRAKVHRTHEIPESELAPQNQSLPTFNSMVLSFSNYNDTHNMQNDLNEHTYLELERVSIDKHISLFDPDYNLASVRIHDSSIELYENDDQVPFRITIFNCDLPRLRGDRLLIDFFNANNVTGTVNNSMFTIHKHQTFTNSENTVRFKLDGIDMGSLSKANPQLKFNWLINGSAEIVADIRLPNFDAMDSEKNSAAVPSVGFFQWIMDEIKDLTQPKQPVDNKTNHNDNLFTGAIAALYETFTKPREPEQLPTLQGSDYVIVNVTVKFRNLKATLPSYLPMASSAPIPFITLQNLRSLIGFINGLESNDPIVIKTMVIEKISDLHNLDIISQTRIFDTIVSDIYDDLCRMIKLDEKRIMDERSQMWSHSVISQLLLLGIGALA